MLDGGHTDPRLRKANDRQLPILEMHHLDSMASESGPTEDSTSTADAQSPRSLTPGAVMDILSEVTDFTVNVAWAADQTTSLEVDVVAFELDRDNQVPSDDAFVFYNQPASPDGAIRLRIDGDREQGVAVDLSDVSEEIDRITIGASIEGATFGEVGALSVTVDTSEFTIATAVLDAATTEQSMIIAEIYRRNGSWRLRALGQGYDDGLAELAVRHGVEVDD